jgi:hypothetical protein
LLFRRHIERSDASSEQTILEESLMGLLSFFDSIVVKKLPPNELLPLILPGHSYGDKQTRRLSTIAETRLFLKPEFSREVVRRALLDGLRSQTAQVREISASHLDSFPPDEEIIEAMLFALNDTADWVRQGARSYFLFKTHTFPVPLQHRAIQALEQAAAEATSESEKGYAEEGLIHIRARCGM